MRAVPGLEKINITLNTEGELEIAQAWSGCEDAAVIVIPLPYVDLFIQAVQEVAKETQG